MATPSQEITITYGSFAVGGTTGRILEAYHTFEKGPVTTAIEYSFVIPQVASASAMATALDAAETAFRTPYGALTVVQSSATLLSLSHSANTGFNAMPRIIKTESLADTGRSRRYVVRIDFGMPADTFTAYRRESEVVVTYDPSRRRHAKITVVYTGTTAPASASVTALANGPTFAGTVISALTGTWEQITEDYKYDDQNKVATWSRTYDELIFSDGGSSDDTGLVGGTLTISREKTAPGDFSSAAKRLATLTLKYHAALDKDVTTAIMTKFDAIRSWLITQAQNTLGSGSLAVIAETVTPDYPNNALDVAMTIQGTTGGSVFEWAFDTEDFVEEGGVLVGLWSGRKFDKHLFQGAASYLRTETAVQVLSGNLNINQLMDAGATGIGGGAKDAVVFGQEPGPRGLDSFVRLTKRPKVTHETRGITGNSFSVTKVTVITITAWYTKPVGGGGGVVFTPLTTRDGVR